MDFTEAPEASDPSESKPTNKGPVRIMIADDHPIVRDGLKKLLRLESDFEIVAEAGDGGEVLEMINQTHPDILLLDLRMPNLDGLAVLQALQQCGGDAAIFDGLGYVSRSRPRTRAEPAFDARTRDRVPGGARLQKQGNGREDVYQRADGEESPAQHL